MKKILTILLTFAVVLTTLSYPVFAASKSQNKSKINSLEESINANEKKLASIKSDKNKQEDVKKLLEQQISDLQQQISVCNNEISDLKSKINEKESQIKKNEAVIESTKSTLKQRIRAIYMSGSASSEILIMLSSDNFGDYLTSRGLARSISSKDKSIVDEINKAIDVIEKAKKEIEAQMAEQNQIKATLDSKNASLKQKQAQVNSVISSLSTNEAYLKKQNAQKQAEINRLTREIQSGMQSGNNQNVKYTGGAFAWPVPGYYGITSGYGYRWGSLHAGMDISSSGIYGARIVAAMDGVVMVSGWSTGGYGYYVTINHGYKDGKYYTTLYGHMSRTGCSSGQSVKKGQTIGYVGSTGWSTGAHCHFEVRINGSTVNPAQFF